MRRLILNMVLAAASCTTHAVGSPTISANVLQRLQERIYGHPVTVQGQLSDGYRTDDYRDLSVKVGQMTSLQKTHLPLDSTLADAAHLIAAQASSSRGHRHRGTLRSLNLPALEADLELRFREIGSMQLTAVAKALEQRMYWDVYEGLLSLQRKAQRNAAEQPATVAVVGWLAQLIHLLRLTPAEIAALSSYDQLALLRRVFAEHDLSFAAPSIVDVSNRRNTSMHAIALGGRSCFEGRAILGNATAEDKKLLSDWRAKRDLEQQALNQEIPAERLFSSQLPDYPPSGTVLALLRHMIVFDTANAPRALPVVESVALRFFSIPDGARHESYALYELDQEASLQSAGWQYFALPDDELVWSGLLNGRPDRLSAQGLALITTMSNNCAFCHNFAAPGPGQLVAFSVGRPSTSSEDATDQCTLTLRHLKETAAYSQLHAQLQRLDGERP